MNIEIALLQEHSLKNTQFIANYICNNPTEINSLLIIFNGNNHKLIQRAAWPLLHIANKHIDILKPHIPVLISLLDKSFHVSVKRNVLRVLQDLTIPEECYGNLINHCFAYLSDPKEPIAVKAFSMQVLYNAAIIYPDLKNEIILLIENNLIDASPGIKNRGNKIIKLLNKM